MRISPFIIVTVVSQETRHEKVSYLIHSGGIPQNYTFCRQVIECHSFSIFIMVTKIGHYIAFHYAVTQKTVVCGQFEIELFCIVIMAVHEHEHKANENGCHGAIFSKRR